MSGESDNGQVVPGIRNDGQEVAMDLMRQALPAIARTIIEAALTGKTDATQLKAAMYVMSLFYGSEIQSFNNWAKFAEAMSAPVEVEGSEQ